MPKERGFVASFLALLKKELVSMFEALTLKIEMSNITALTTPLLRIARNAKLQNDLQKQGNDQGKELQATVIDHSKEAKDTFKKFSDMFEAAMKDTILELRDHTAQLDALSKVTRTVEVSGIGDIKHPLNELQRWSEGAQDISRKSLNALSAQMALLKDVHQSLEKISKNKVDFPKVQQVKGDTRVTTLPKIPELGKMTTTLTKIHDSLKKESKSGSREKDIRHREQMAKMYGEMLASLKDIKESIESIPSAPEIEFPETINVGNFPPQKYPLPPTHMSINALAGFVKSRSVTVTTALTPLPAEILKNRRSIIVYNNSNSVVEIGGANFTFGNGMPIPPSTYSPSIDAGVKMVVYARVESGTADVRTMEVSDINVGR